MSDNTEVQASNEYYQTDNQSSQLNQLNLNSNNVDALNSTKNSLCGELSQIIQNFYKVDIKEIGPTTQDIKETIFEDKIDELVNLYFDEVNKGREENIRKQFVLDYFNNNNINLQEVYNWILNNQTSSNSIYLLGYFNYHGIETNINKKNAFDLYQKAAKLENIVTQYELINMYINRECVDKDYKKKAFELSKKLTERKHPSGMNNLGHCYDKGFGTEVNEQKAFGLYKKAADLGNLNGIYNLGRCYENGNGIYVDKKKAFELYQKVADSGSSRGINRLGRCYDEGIGTNVEKKKAFELFQKAANLGYVVAQYNLASMHENGEGTKKNLGQAIYWFKKSAEQGDKVAQEKLKKLYNIQ